MRIIETPQFSERIRGPSVKSEVVPAPLLASVSRSFYLSLRFLPEPVRGPLGLAYLLARASDTVADAAQAALALRLEALDAFRAALEPGQDSEADAGEAPDRVALVESLFGQLRCTHPGEARLLAQIRPILGCYQRLSQTLQEETRAVLDTIIKAQREDLVRFGYANAQAPQCLATAAETEAYTYAVAGCVGEFWTRLCVLQLPGFAVAPVEELLRLGRRFGQGLQLVNILRDLPADLREGRCYLPADELREAGLSAAALLEEPERARPVVERWLAEAQACLADGEAYVAGIRGKRLRFSVSLPRRLGQETLALLQRHPPLETAHRLRVGRATVFRSAAAAFAEALR